MLLLFLVAVAAFFLGVLLAVIPALYFIGVMHAEAVRIVDGYGGMALFTAPAPAPGLRLVADNE